MATLDRLVPNSTTPGAVLGDPYMDEVSIEIGGLWDRSAIALDTVGGTADAITARCTPALAGALVNGMKFTITPTAANTISGLTLRIDGPGGVPTGSVIGIVDRDGNALASAQWKSGRRHLIEFDSALGKHRVLGNIEPTPVAAIPQPSFRNILANGGGEVWQRGAGDSASIAVGASTTLYTADRWYLTTGASQTTHVNRQPGITNRSRASMGVQRDSGQTGTSALVYAYALTTEECIRLRGSPCSFQFAAAADGNFSPVSGTLTYNVYFGTGTEGRRGAGFTGETNPITGSVNLTPGGAMVATTATSAGNVATNVTQGEVRFTWTPTGTAGVADGVRIDDVQLESGSSATAFEYLPFDIMLRMCQRHFQKTFPYNTAPAQGVGFAGAIIGEKDINVFASLVSTQLIGASQAGITAFTSFGTSTSWSLPVVMRVTPSITTYNPGAANANWRLPGGASGGATDSAVTVSPASSDGDRVVNMVGSGATSDASNTMANTGASVGRMNAYIHAIADAGL